MGRDIFGGRFKAEIPPWVSQNTQIQRRNTALGWRGAGSQGRRAAGAARMERRGARGAQTGGKDVDVGVRGCGHEGLGEPSRDRARRGGCGRATAATCRQLMILWSPQKSKVMCVC